MVYDVARGLHIGFGVFEKDRGINAFDSIAEHMEHAVSVVEKGHHVGVVNAGEGLIVAVFEQRTGADGNGTAGGFDEGEDVAF